MQNQINEIFSEVDEDIEGRDKEKLLEVLTRLFAIGLMDTSIFVSEGLVDKDTCQVLLSDR